METKGVDFEQLRIKLEKPVKLSETEIKKIDEIFTDFIKILGDVRNEVLAMDQPYAYRYMEILLKKFIETKAEFEGKIVTQAGPRPTAPPIIRVERKPGDFREYFDQLTLEQQEIAQRKLDCVKSALKLEEAGENPSAPLCADCSLEAMMNCIRLEDPSIRDEMDVDLEKARQAAAHQ